MQEIWKDVPNYEGLYQISNLGNVKSLRATCHHNKIKILKPICADGKYLRVSLYKNKVHKFYMVHRLVAISFIPNPYNKPEVNHLNGNKFDNKASNLEWCTSSENKKHAFKLGLNKGSKPWKGKNGFDNHSSKAVLQYNPESKKIIRIYGSIAEASRNTGCLPSKIVKCCKGTAKHTHGMYFRYMED